MFNLPKLKQIQDSWDLNVFASTYFQCSGFNVHPDYYKANQVFGIWQGEQMIGGFVLGTAERLRTLDVFAGDAHRETLYQQVQQAPAHTEICCFWMDPGIRKKTGLNFFVWLCVAYALQVYGTTQLIFGTNSARLAALYSATPKCRLLHSDYVNHKNTFIFTGPRKDCLVGVGQILIYKMKRLISMVGKRNKWIMATASFLF